MTPLDSFDLAILRLVQRNNQMPLREIGAAVHLSAPSVQRRLRRMEEEGVITANVARISAKAVGVPLTIITLVELDSETPAEIARAQESFRAAPEVQECHYVTGEADFVLVLHVADMSAYQALVRRLFIDNGNVRKFLTMVSMETVKDDTALNF